MKSSKMIAPLDYRDMRMWPSCRIKSLVFKPYNNKGPIKTKPLHLNNELKKRYRKTQDFK